MDRVSTKGEGHIAMPSQMESWPNVMSSDAVLNGSSGDDSALFQGKVLDKHVIERNCMWVSSVCKKLTLVFNVLISTICFDSMSIFCIHAVI